MACMAIPMACMAIPMACMATPIGTALRWASTRHSARNLPLSFPLARPSRLHERVDPHLIHVCHVLGVVIPYRTVRMKGARMRLIRYIRPHAARACPTCFMAFDIDASAIASHMSMSCRSSAVRTFARCVTKVTQITQVTQVRV